MVSASDPRRKYADISLASVFVTVDRVVVSDDGLQLKRTAINKFEIPGRPLRKDNLEGDFYVRDNCDEVRIVRWTTSSMEQMDYTSFKPNTSDRVCHTLHIILLYFTHAPFRTWTG